MHQNLHFCKLCNNLRTEYGYANMYFVYIYKYQYLHISADGESETVRIEFHVIFMTVYR